MKNLMVAGLALGLSLLVACDKAADKVETEEVSAAEHSHGNTDSHSHDDVNSSVESTEEDYNTKTPGDLSEALQNEMLVSLANYNACMQKPREEYFMDGLDPQKKAGEVMEECEAHLASIQKMLDENGVNKQFTLGILKKRRNQSARKLMSNIMNAKVAREMQLEQEGGLSH